MPYVGTDFGAADPGALEEDVYSFDFAARLGPGETLSGAGTWALSSPSDSSASSRMIGLPVLSGTIVSQTIGGLLAGEYLIEATVTTSLGRTLTAWSHIACIAPA